jgi:putative transposase
MNGSYTLREMVEIPVRAASRGDSIEQTVKSLEGTPSSTSIRYHLEKLDDMTALEAQNFLQILSGSSQQIEPMIAS